jgi:UDP-N-acetylglucosamine 4,6-dehydratase
MNEIKNKTILVTGGTGSFGNKFVDRSLYLNPKKIIIFSRDEFKQYEMSEKYKNHKESKKLRFFLGDIRDYKRLKLALIGVDIIIHAAALKIVDTAEYNPMESIRTNINGAENIISAALDNNVSKVINISTDKAVNPINLYGATKLAADKLFIAANNYSGNNFKTKFSIVRYGNVIGSRGSVIPFFKKLIKENSAFLPITDPEMTRFWIRLEDGVNFVISSLQKMKGGEIFIPKMPSVLITDLAKCLSSNAKLKIVGTRPGEKLHEVLCSYDDATHVFESKKSYVILPSIFFEEFKKYNYIINSKSYKKINKKFQYDSLSNDRFLKLKEIKKIII